MKKLLGIALALVMLLSCCGVFAEDGGDLTIVWSVTEDAYKAAYEANPDSTFDAIWSVIPQYEALYGGKVTVIATDWGGMTPKVIEMVNAGESVDICQAHDQNFPVYPARNIVMPIGNYVDVNDDLYFDSVTAAFTFGGTPYAVGTSSAPVVIYYNVDMFDNNGVKTPREYYEEGNWTWDTFREVAMELTQDTDGDGENDQFGFGWWDTDYTAFLASNGTTNLLYNDDGTIGTSYLTDAGIETMTFLQNAYTVDKYIWPAAGGDDFVSGFKNGKLAMTMEYGFAYMLQQKNGDLDFEVDYVAMPKGPHGEGDTGLGGMSGWCIGVTSANPTGAAKFIELSCKMLKEYNDQIAVELYGQEEVDHMNYLAGLAKFVPIGIDGYWDNNWVVYTGLRSDTPVATFLAQADEIIAAGVKSTLEN